MKQVPNGCEEGKTARDGTSGPVTYGKVCVPNGCGLIVRAMEKDASVNPMRVVNVEKPVLKVRVGESVDRLVRAENALQQAERRLQSQRKVSEVRKERGAISR